MHSAIYEGFVLHHRLGPKRHRFRYRLFMLYLDLAELDDVFRGRWFWSTRRAALARFRRADHFGDAARPLDVCVRDLVEAKTGQRPLGPIRLLTHLRYFGYVMNPVCFYFCFAQSGDRLEAIVADVSNTPWNERHQYVLTPKAETAGQALVQQFAKSFHVSPFMPMQQEYHWSFTQPGQALSVTMRNLERGESRFHAVLKLKRKSITSFVLARLLLSYPLLTVQVIGGIYLQAFRLWLKKTPYFEHPRHRQHPLAPETLAQEVQHG